MASGQEIVDRILKSYNVEFDSNVSGKLNEFMIRYTIDILRQAKHLSIFENKETFSLIEVRQAIRQMKENKGITFDEMKSLMKEMPVYNLEEDLKGASIYDSIFKYDENILQRNKIKIKVDDEMRIFIEEQKKVNIEKEKEDKDNPDIGVIFKPEIRYGLQPAPVVQPVKPQEEEDDYE